MALESAETNEPVIDLLDLLQILADNLRLLVLGPLLAGLVALGITYLQTPSFAALTRFMPPLQQQSNSAAMLQSLGALGGLAGATTGIKNPNEQFVGLLASETIANALVAKFKLLTRYDTDLQVDARLRLANKTQILVGKSNLITVEVEDTDPAIAAQIANAYVEELGNMMGRLTLTEAQNRRAFFDKQVDQTRKKLAAAEAALQSQGVNSSALKSSPEASIKAVAEIQARISAQEVKVSTMRGYLAEASPDFKMAMVELAALRGQLAKTETIAAPTSGNAADANYIARIREVKYYETLTELFAKQFELAKADEAREGPVIQVVDIAEAPERKSRPKRAQVALIASLGSGVLLLLFVFVRHGFRSAKGAPESAEKMQRLALSWRRSLGRS